LEKNSLNYLAYRHNCLKKVISVYTMLPQYYAKTMLHNTEGLIKTPSFFKGDFLVRQAYILAIGSKSRTCFAVRSVKPGARYPGYGRAGCG